MIPITLKSVYDALVKVFPRDARAIISCITDVVIAKKDTALAQYITTLGIDYQGKLYISEKFWEEHITSVEALSTILLHELMHQVTGDTWYIKQFQEDKKEGQLKALASNIAQDCRINAYICQYSNIPGAKEVFEGIYTKELLETSPLMGLLTPNGGDYIPTKEMKALYDSYYSPTKKDIHGFLKLYYLVLEWLRENAPPKMVLVIGNHGQICDENGNPIDDRLPDDIKEAVKEYIKEKGIQVDKSSKQAGYSETLQSTILQEALGIDQKLDVQQLKKLSFDSVMTNIRLQMMETTNEKAKSLFLPTSISRVDLFKMLYDIIPPYWDTRVQKLVPKPRKVPIYLDVSGSMWSYLPTIIQMILNIRNDIDFVWGFSNDVALHTIEDLANNKIHSTGGTDFDCIIEHSKANEFSSILVITDGYAYCKQPNGHKVEHLNEVITVLCSDSRSDENYFCKTYEDTIQIEDITV